MKIGILAEQILLEPEFKENGFVFKHLEQGRPDPLRAVQSAVDRMRELHDIEDCQFGPLCEEVLRQLSIMFDKLFISLIVMLKPCPARG